MEEFIYLIRQTPEPILVAGAEATAALVGYGIAYLGFRYLGKKDWGTSDKKPIVRKIVLNERVLGPHTEAAIEDVNIEWKKLGIPTESLYVDVTIDKNNKKVQFWGNQIVFEKVQNPGPSLRKRIAIGISSALLVVGSTALAGDGVGRVWGFMTSPN